MRLPRGERPQLLLVVHRVEVGQHFSRFVYGIWWNAFKAVLRIESLEAFMDKASHFSLTVARSLTLIKVRNFAHAGARHRLAAEPGRFAHCWNRIVRVAQIDVLRCDEVR